MVRKIDRLSEELEKGLCELFLIQIRLKKDAEFFRGQLKAAADFNIVHLFKDLAFTDTQSCTKIVHPNDLQRIFVMNSLMLEPARLNLFYSRLV